MSDDVSTDPMYNLSGSPRQPAASDEPTGNRNDEAADGRATDARIARQLDSLIQRARQGEVIEIDREIEGLGAEGRELRQLWGAVMLADAVGSHAAAQQQPGEQANSVGQSDEETSGRSPENVSQDPQSLRNLPYVFGDYELLEEIGRGGMGVVYRARQISLDRTVAIKMLLRGQWASPIDQVRFRAEAEAVAKLDHRNIVPVYEVGEREGFSFFSMKYIEGETLAQRLHRGPLPPREAAALVRKVAETIQFAHEKGILHRDLKPSNIMVDDEGEPHVMDFGLAKQVSDAASLTRSGAVLGTPTYMAPEQAAGNRGQVGVTSDVYSLGTILYHMLTGRPPYQAGSPMEIVLKVLEQDPPLPRTLDSRVDRDLEMIALRCLQKPQDLRYPSAAALANDLSAYLTDEPLSAQSGRLTHVVSRLFRETHHATVLENWGVLWMWHSLALIVVCFVTNVMHLRSNESRLSYFLLWTAGLGTWAAVFWMLRRRMGPVTFVERQIAHLWAASMISIGVLFPVEFLLGLPPLKLSPVLALSSGMVFLAKAGILSGTFYIQATTLFITAIVMAYWLDYAHFVFGLVSAACFFFPGWKYYRQRSSQ